MEKLRIKFTSDGSVTRIVPDPNFIGFKVGDTVCFKGNPYTIKKLVYFKTSDNEKIPALILNVVGYDQPISIDEVSRVSINNDHEPEFIFR